MSSAGEIALELEAAGFNFNTLNFDTNGDLVVTGIVGRTGTLATLQQTVGSAGELAVATDLDVIVKMTGGSVTGGVEFHASSQSFGATPIGCYSPTEVFPQLTGNSADFLSFCSFTTRLFIAVETTGLTASYDGISWFKIQSPPVVDCNIYSDGVNLIAVPRSATSTVYYYCTTPFSAWLTSTSTTAAAATLMQAPIAVSMSSALVIASGSNNQSALIAAGGDSTGKATMPGANANWVLPVAPQYNNTSQAFALTCVAASTRVAKMTDVSTLPVWTENALPVALPAGAPWIRFVDSTAIIGSLYSTAYYTATFNIAAGTLSSWTARVLPFNVNSEQRIVSNATYVFIANPGYPNDIRYSTDGITWQTMSVTNTTYNSLIALASGLYLEAAAGGTFLSSPTAAYGIDYHNNFISTYFTSQKAFFDTIVFPPQSSVLGGVSTISVQPLQATPTLAVSYATAAIVSGTPILLPLGCRSARFNNAATIASLPVSLPALPTSGQVVTLSIKSIITTLTVSTQAAPTGQTINGAATLVLSAVPANALHTFVYDLASNSWVH